MKVKKVGLFIPDILDPYQVEVLNGIYNEISRYDYQLIILNGGAINYDDRRHKYRNHLYDYVLNIDPDIILLISAPLFCVIEENEIKDFLQTFKHIPKLSIGIELPGIPSVVVDNKSGIREMMTHFICDHNCKNIAFIKGPDNNLEARLRFKAYREGLEEHHIPYREELVLPGEFLASDGRDGVITLLDKRKVSFDALIAVDDYGALSAMEELFRRNIDIPSDVLIGGFDDTQTGEVSNPTLTTVHQPLLDLGKQSVELVHKIFQKEDVSLVTLVATPLVKRESCGCESTITHFIPVKKNRDSDEKDFSEKERSYQDYIQHLLFRNIRHTQATNDLLSFGENLSTCYSSDELRSTLKAVLPRLGIENYYIVRSFSGNNLFNYFFQCSAIKTILSEQYVSIDEIFSVLFQVVYNTPIIIIPLVTVNSPLGFVVYDYKPGNEIIYDYLAQKTSSVIKGIDLLDQVKKYADELEEKVAMRTKELQKMNELLRKQSFQDQLSGLNNRRFLKSVIIPRKNEMLKKISDSRDKYNRDVYYQSAIIMIDIDFFKIINDNYGHDSGDTIIIDFSRILKESIHSDDYVVRMGGEEFLVIMNNFNPDFLYDKIEDIRKSIEKYEFVMQNEEKISRTCSLGAVIFPQCFLHKDRIDFSTAITLADKALYEAKEAGRNRGIILSMTDAFLESTMSASMIIHDIKKAVKDALIVLNDTTMM